jgi:methionyl-tRNA formyltransferase
MRIVYFGSGDIGLPALEWLLESEEHEVVGVVSQPDKPVGRHQELTASPIKQLALRHGSPVLQPTRMRDAAAIEAVQQLAPDVIVVMAYGQILPKAILDAPKVACLNLHASLLPRHRGASPIQAAIEAGDSHSGITVMYMAEGLDTGDILLTHSFPIRRRETGGTLHDRLAAASPKALQESLALLQQGTAPRIPQDPSLATYAPKLTREYGEIQWDRPAIEIDRKIRAMNPWPCANTFLPNRQGAGGAARKLKVFSGIVCRKSQGAPGEVLRADQNGILVGAAQDALLLRELQLEGKRRMSARDFLLGNPISPGTRLGLSPTRAADRADQGDRAD